MKHLVIVESPNKIKVIKKYIGDEYEVMASVGHIVYLPSSGEHRFGVDLKTWMPNYKVDPEKTSVVADLKKAAQKSDIVYVATDPDREGEAIADNLVNFLNIGDKYARIRFNEITQDAIQKALASPDKIDEELVKSQVARRILDRIIGYKLSSLMKQKISSAPTNPSAGRVQSIALKLTCLREEEIERFIPFPYFTLEAIIDAANEIVANYYDPDSDLDNKEWIKVDDVEVIKNALTKKLTIDKVVHSKKTEARLTPFKQAALYKKADSSLGLSAGIIQSAAQRLYENGLISYPRTDSTRLSETFVKAAQQYIVATHGQDYLATDIKGSAGAQDAHEAIRPTDLSLLPDDVCAKLDIDKSRAEYKIYNLIWTQTMQSLMKPPIREITRYELLTNDVRFRMSSSRVVYDGYYVVTGYEAKRELPVFKEGDQFDVQEFNFNEHKTEPPARYNDGSLIEKLDQIGVGRPSTFASTVNTLKEREYVELIGRALKPTTFGRIVFSKLAEAFPEIMNEEYTAKMERELDEIADGKYRYETVLDSFWETFQKDLLAATSELNITQLGPILANKKCPKCGAELVVRRNKKDGTKFFGCSTYPICKHSEPDPNEKGRFKVWKKRSTKKSTKSAS